MADGWIKIHRQLAENELWFEEPFTNGQAWVDLLLLANHKPGVINVRGIRMEVGRGELGWSEVRLAERWKWSRGKVRRFLHFLVQQNMIQTVQQKNCVTTLIHITNYDLYQSDDTANSTANDTAGDTANGQQTDTNKNVKNISKTIGKSKTIKTSSPESLRLSGLLADLILQNNPNVIGLGNGKRNASVARWAEDIDRLIRIDKVSADDIEETIQFCQQDEFWAPNILSGGTLRKQWDKLRSKMMARKQGGGRKEKEFFDPTRGCI